MLSQSSSSSSSSQPAASASQYFFGLFRRKTVAAAAASPLSDNSVDQEHNQFPLWSADDKALLENSQLEPNEQFAVNSLILLMDKWVHARSKGWYHAQLGEIKQLLTPVEENIERVENQLRQADEEAKLALRKELSNLIENQKVLIEIKTSLHKYLQTAFNLRKPKKGQIERVKIPNKDSYIEGYANGYRYFWHQCTYTTFHSFLLYINKLNRDQLSESKAKLYVYSLLKLKEQEMPNLLIAEDDLQRLMLDTDKVILNLKSKYHLNEPIMLNEAEIYQAINIPHEIMPKYLPLIDLKKEFDASPLYAQYVHVRPAIMIQFAQLLDYIYAMLEPATTHKLNYTNHFPSQKSDKLQAILTVLANKRKEIATVMAFQERLVLTFGRDDMIESLHQHVDNKSAQLLPTDLFFNFEQSQTFQLTEFDSDDVNAPKPIPREEHSRWRRAYIVKYGDIAVHEIEPISQHYLQIWLDHQVRIEKEAKVFYQDNAIPLQMVRCISIGSMEKHNLFLMKKLPDQTRLSESMFENAYIFLNYMEQKILQQKVFYVTDGKAKLLPKSSLCYKGVLTNLSVKNEYQPLQHTLDKKTLAILHTIICANEGHLHLCITKPNVPTLAIHSVFNNQQTSLAAAYNDSLVGNGFISSMKETNNMAYDFFIHHYSERRIFFQINSLLKSANFLFLLRQVDRSQRQQATVESLFWSNPKKLTAGPQGAETNFAFLIQALKTIVPAGKHELSSVNTAIQHSNNSAHVLALTSYARLVTDVYTDVVQHAKRILMYWMEMVKNIYPLPDKHITQFNHLLREAIIALDDQPMLDYFYSQVFGAIVFPEGEKAQAFNQDSFGYRSPNKLNNH